jgi:hypothetical protein
MIAGLQATRGPFGSELTSRGRWKCGLSVILDLSPPKIRLTILIRRSPGNVDLQWRMVVSFVTRAMSSANAVAPIGCIAVGPPKPGAPLGSVLPGAAISSHRFGLMHLAFTRGIRCG